MRGLAFFSVLAALLSCAGCAYRWQGASNIWAKEKIERIYIRTLDNRTLTPGVETFFTSSIIREFSKGKRLIVTSSEEEADAVLWGRIDAVNSAGSTEAELGRISSANGVDRLAHIPIFTEYTASASVSLNLTRRKDGRLIWSSAFGHPGYLYPGNVRFGLPGTTTALINDSEFKLALNEVAKTIATDAYDALLEAF